LDAQTPAASPGAVSVAAPLTGDTGCSDLVESKKPEDDAAKSSAVADSNIRVGVGLLDKLMDLVGELVLTRNQILQYNMNAKMPRSMPRPSG